MPRSSWPARAIVAAVLLLFGGTGHAQTTLERIQAEDRVRIAIADEAPYGYRDAEGEVTGEAPSIARAVLARIDPAIEIEWISTDFGDLIPGLQQERFDIAAAGIFITPERCAEVAFSQPTYVVGEAFAVKAGNPKGIIDYETISADEDTRVGLIAGTVEPNYALVTGIPADRAPLYRTFAKAVEALKAGEIDAIGMTALTAQEIAAAHPDLAATGQFFPSVDGVVTKGYGGFAFRKADVDLRDAFDAVLDDFIGSDAHWELVAPFGFGPAMAPDASAEELCEG